MIRALRLMVPASAVVLLLTFTLFYSRYQVEIAELQLSASKSVAMAEAFASKEFSGIVSDLRVMAKDEAVVRTFAEETFSARERLSRKLKDFISEKRIFDRIFLLDLQGREIVRVEYHDGSVESIPTYQLRDHGSHPDFNKAKELGGEQYYVSPVEFNPSGTHAGEPYEPSMQFFVRVFDPAQRKAGLLAFSYPGRHLLKSIRELIPPSATSMPLLLSADGYYLMAPGESLEGQDTSGGEAEFAVRYPGVQKRFSAATQGKVATGNELFVFHTVRVGDNRIVIASRTDLNAFISGFLRKHVDGLLIALLLLMVTGLASWEIAGSRLLQEYWIRSEKKLLDFKETASDWIWETDADLRFIEISNRLKDLTGINPTDYIGRRFDELMTLVPEQQGITDEPATLASHKIIKKVIFQTENFLGQTLLFAVSAKPLIVDGVFQGYRGTSQDVTNYRQLIKELQGRVIAAEIAEQRSERFAQKMTEAQRIARTGSWSLDLSAKELNWSDEMLRIFGIGREEFDSEQDPYVDAVYPDDRAGVDEQFTRAIKHGDIDSLEHRIVRKNDGAIRWIQTRFEFHHDDAGRITRCDGTVQDITERKEAEQLIEQSEQDFRNVFNYAGDGMLIHDLAGRIMEVNAVICSRLGYNRQELLSMAPAALDAPEYAANTDEQFQKVAKEGGVCFETVHLAKSGKEIPSEINSRMILHNGQRAILSVIRDITERKVAEDEIRRLASTDALTGLANRRYFDRKFADALAYAERYEQMVGLLMVDLDRFKLVNDRFGHQVGDRMLRQAAEILLANSRGTDTVARLGGDEFAIVTIAPRDRFSMEQLAGRIVEAFASPMDLMGRRVQIGASIGIAVFPTDSDQAVDLIAKADIALYAVKLSGRNGFKFYHPAMADDSSLQMQNPSRADPERK